MLSKFRVKNFKSFMNDTIIDLNKTNYRILANKNIAENNILKGALFVGGNATGKTNLILSLKFLLELFFSNNMNPFNLNKCLFSTDEQPLEVEYEFTIDTQILNYTIKYDFQKKIIFETLTIDNKIILDRKGEYGESQITENKMYTDLPSDNLLLREIYYNTKFRGHEILQKWFQFLSNSVYINPYKNIITSSEHISNNLIEYLNENDAHEINDFFYKLGFDQRIEYSANMTTGNNIFQNAENKKEIFFRRNNMNTPIPYNYESLGNQNLVKLLPQYLNVIKNSGMLIIDEFSSGFHNILEELLVKYFMQNAEKSQIYIVSHSTNLLSNSIFRPDQIYTVDFNTNNGSSIKRISAEKPREAQNIEKMYLNGIFEGIPSYNEY